MIVNARDTLAVRGLLTRGGADRTKWEEIAMSLRQQFRESDRYNTSSIFRSSCR